MSAPTAEERASLRDGLGDLVEFLEGNGTVEHIERLCPLLHIAGRVVDALDTAERERTESAIDAELRRETSVARIATLEAEVAAAKQPAADVVDAFERATTALSQLTPEQQVRVLRAALIVIGEEDPGTLRADLARVTGELAEAKSDRESLGDQIADCNTTLVGIEKALIAAGIELPEDCDYGRAIAEALTTSQRDREKLQGERDAALKALLDLSHSASCDVNKPREWEYTLDAKRWDRDAVESDFAWFPCYDRPGTSDAGRSPVEARIRMRAYECTCGLDDARREAGL